MLDEFALVFHLEDVYWEDEGRQSVVATVLGAAVIVLMLVLTAPAGLHTDTFSDRSRVYAVGYLGGNALFALICFLKGKPFVGLTAIFVPLVGLVGATRLAHPKSPWAHVFYDEAKLERARDPLHALPRPAGAQPGRRRASAASRTGPRRFLRPQTETSSPSTTPKRRWRKVACAKARPERAIGGSSGAPRAGWKRSVSSVSGYVTRCSTIANADREPEGVAAEPLEERPEDEPRDGAVHDVQHPAGGAPVRPAGDELAEDRDVGVREAEEPLVERLEQPPRRSRRGSRERRPGARGSRGVSLRSR